MPFSAINDPEQRAILNAVLDDICLAAGIVDGHERDEAANLIMRFYRSGYRTADELMAAFNHTIRQERFAVGGHAEALAEFDSLLSVASDVAGRKLMDLERKR
jgi:hypothetical protein